MKRNLSNYQILGVVITISLSILLPSCQKKGCTDDAALNYESEAKKDDGSCIYLKKGCTDSYAINYDETAQISDGSCIYKSNTILVALDHVIDNSRLELDTIMYTNEAGNQYSITTLKYIVSRFKLHKPDGNTVSFDNVHLRDIKKDGTRWLYLENVPDGYYNGLSFTYGLNTNDNVTGAFNDDSDFQNMDWPAMMGGGYHHMKMEGKFIDTSGSILFFNTHTGTSTSGNNDIRFSIPDISFTIDKNIVEIQLVMNINEWYRNPNIYNFAGYVSGIMGNDSAQQILRENGKDIWSSGNVAYK